MSVDELFDRIRRIGKAHGSKLLIVLKIDMKSSLNFHNINEKMHSGKLI